MYIPGHFRQEERDAIFALMQSNAFASLVTVADGVPFASHVPFLVDREQGENGVLTAHLARANPQWKHFGEGQEVLVLFQGPHSYISPDWYATGPSVPTWNYAVVHAYGVPKIVDEARLREIVLALTAHFDPNLPEIAPDYVSKLLPAIVGFEIEITRLEAKWKLSQNKTPADRNGVIMALQNAPGENERAVAGMMAGENAETVRSPVSERVTVALRQVAAEHRERRQVVRNAIAAKYQLLDEIARCERISSDLDRKATEAAKAGNQELAKQFEAEKARYAPLFPPAEENLMVVSESVARMLTALNEQQHTIERLAVETGIVLPKWETSPVRDMPPEEKTVEPELPLVQTLFAPGPVQATLSGFRSLFRRREPEEKTAEAIINRAVRELMRAQIRNREAAVQLITQANVAQAELARAERTIANARKKAETARQEGNSDEVTEQELFIVNNERKLPGLRQTVAETRTLADDAKAQIHLEEERIRTKTAEALAAKQRLSQARILERVNTYMETFRTLQEGIEKRLREIEAALNRG